MLRFILWLAYLIDPSKVIKVGGKQKPYKMWQVGISLAASPLANSLTGFAREVIWRLCCRSPRSRIPPAMQAEGLRRSLGTWHMTSQLDICLPYVGNFLQSKK